MDNAAPGIRDRLVVLSPWSRIDAEALMRRFFEEVHGQTSLYRLTVVPTKEEAYLPLVHGNDIATYDNTTAEIQRLGLPRDNVAQILGIGPSATMMFREGRSVSKRIVGGAKDPTVLSAGGHEFRLLAFWLTVSRQTNPRLYGLTLYARSDEPLSIAATFAVAEKLALATQLDSVSIQVRTDDWFLESPGFPAVFPFTSETHVPIEGIFRRAPSASCTWRKGKGVICGGQSFQP